MSINQTNVADNIEMKKRIYKVSLLLRRKPINIVVQSITQTWGVKQRQAYNYIRLARKEWQKYFDHLTISGMGYYVSQLRDLKDQAYKCHRVIKRGDTEVVVKTPNLPLVFEITKEEAKLMGQYPAERHEIDVVSSFAGWLKKVKETKELGTAKSEAYIDGEVLEDSEDEDEQIDEDEEESRKYDEISEKVPEGGGDNSKRTNEIKEEDFKM